MPHYVAIVVDAGPESAIGIWFPDLPGCFSAGDDVDEASVARLSKAKSGASGAVISAYPRGATAMPEDSNMLFELDWMPHYPELVRAFTELYGRASKPPMT